METDFLTFENVMVHSPHPMSGDLHLVPEGIFFLTFRRENAAAIGLWMQFGPLGLLMMRRAADKRAEEMTPWREAHAGRPLDELASALPDSVFVAPGEMTRLRKSLMGIQVKRSEGKPLVVEVSRDQREQVLAFAKKQDWPVA